MLRNLALIFIAVITPFLASAQQGRMHRDVFPTFGDYNRSGWVFSPSLNYTMPNLKDPAERIFLTGDSVYQVNYDHAGRLGFGFEFGRFKVIDNSRLISHIELNLGVKVFRGTERFEAVLDDPDTANPSTLNGEGTWQQTYATMSFDASNIMQFSSTSFLQNTLGVNADYRVVDNANYDDRGLPIALDSPTRFIFQAHYRLGWGVKVARNMIVIPSIETPIVTFYQFDDLKSTLKIFNSRYRPLIFRVSILLLDKKAGRKCPSDKPKRKKSESLFGSFK